MPNYSQNPWNGLATRLKNNVVKLELIIKDKLLEQIGDVREKSVLEIGCGTGYWGRCIRSGAYTGVDIDPGNIQAAQESDPLHTYEVMDATIPRTIGEFDIVLAAYLLVNISTPWGISKAIQSAKRNLKPQGRLMVLDLGPEAIYSHSEYVSRTLNGDAKTGSSFLTHLLLCDGSWVTVTNYHWPDLGSRIDGEAFEIESNRTMHRSPSKRGGLVDEDILIVAKPRY